MGVLAFTNLVSRWFVSTPVTMIPIYSLNYHVNGVAGNDENKEAISNVFCMYTEHTGLLFHVLYDNEQKHRMNIISGIRENSSQLSINVLLIFLEL